MVTEGSLDLAADATATMIPYFPAGASKLARALAKAGKLKKGEHAHHCVAQAAKKAEEAREKAKTIGYRPKRHRQWCWPTAWVPSRDAY